MSTYRAVGIVVLVWVCGVGIGNARAAVTTINVPLQAGDTLYVRFQASNPITPGLFNAVFTQFDFLIGQSNYTLSSSLYDDSDSVLATHGPQTTNFFALGTAPMYTDPALGGSGGVATNLSSYFDGNGMASLTWIGPSPVTISKFDVMFGVYSSTSGGFAPNNPFAYTLAVNSLPAAIPEPTGVAIGMGIALMGMRRRRRGVRVSEEK